MNGIRVPFRFDAVNHEYIDLATGQLYPHITGMLERVGLVNDTWYTEASSARGRLVHRLTADYDLGALTPASCVSTHRGYLLAHVAAMQILRPEILSVEEPLVHSLLKFGGRPDRVLRLSGLLAVLEVKSAEPDKAHAIQTALQAILAADEHGLPPEMFGRFALYLKPSGKFVLEEHKRRQDLTEAHRIIRVCCQ